jgi:hypothetical protein
MTEVTLRLDRSKPFSTSHGECAPDDPAYRVRFWQGQRVKNDKHQWEMVLLPFDARDELVPDDGKTAPFEGIADDKKVMHQPLYTAMMRKLLKLKTEKAVAAAQAPAPELEESAEADGSESGGQTDASDDVNFGAWLRGEAKYQPHVLRAAAKTRFSKNYATIAEMVIDLVLDEKVVPESQVCAALAVHLPRAAA